MNDPVMLRKYVREVIGLTPTRRKATTRVLFDGVDKLARAPLGVDELQKAVLWNQTEGYVEVKFDKDEDADVHTLTPAGRKKEGLA